MFSSNFKFRSILSLVTMLTITFSLSAQTDPLADMLKDPSKPAARPQVNASPAMKARLDEIKKDAASQEVSFTLGYTEALGYKLEELCGTPTPKDVSQSAIKAQDALNAKTIQSAEADLKKKGVSAPKLPNSGGVSAGVSASPSTYFTGYTILPAIRNQKGCGSCWAFAACGAFETAFRKFYGTGRTVDMSEQDLVDCGRTGSGQDAGSCSGGHSFWAFDYMRCFGTTTESNRPYVAVNQACAARPKNFRAYCWGQVNADRQTLKNYISAYGSVVTYVQVASSWSGYTGGIIRTPVSSGAYGINHAVTIVGWSDAYNSWIIRNSWGSTFGYGGYAYIDYNACNIGKYNYFVYPYYSGGGVSASAGESVPADFEKSPILEEN
jgi:cathepsin L